MHKIQVGRKIVSLHRTYSKGRLLVERAIRSATQVSGEDSLE